MFARGFAAMLFCKCKRVHIQPGGLIECRYQPDELSLGCFQGGVGHQVEKADMQFRRTRKSGNVFRSNDIATLLGKLFERRQVRMRHERHGFSFPAEPLYDPDQLIENGIRAFRE